MNLAEAGYPALRKRCANKRERLEQDGPTLLIACSDGSVDRAAAQVAARQPTPSDGQRRDTAQRREGKEVQSKSPRCATMRQPRAQGYMAVRRFFYPEAA